MLNNDTIITIDISQANRGLWWWIGKIKKIIPVNKTDHHIFHPLWYVINPNLLLIYSAHKYIPDHNKNHNNLFFHPFRKPPQIY